MCHDGAVIKSRTPGVESMSTSNGAQEQQEISTPSPGQPLCPACFSPSAGFDVPCPVCGYSASQPEEGGWNRLKPGTIIHARYIVGQPLGQGGFGITYLGMDLLLNTKLAIKEYFPAGASLRNPESRCVLPASEEMSEDFRKGMEKFIEEARILARFEEHPSIVSVKDFFEENGTAYMVMNHLEGRTLMAHIKERGGRLPFGEAVSILSPLMDALDEVHASGLIHRDISPDNIFLTRFGQVKLLDFGASKSALALMQQRHHSVILKKGYSPPEQYQGSRHLGPWSDVYGMAATLYRCIAGMIPPDALDRMEEDPLEPPSRLGIPLPQYAETALLRALSLSSQNRPQSMREFKEGLLGEMLFPSGEENAIPRTGRETRTESKKEPPKLAEKAKVCSRGRVRRFFTWFFFFLSVLMLGAGAFFFFAASDLMERAKAGDASAQRSIGRLYEIGGILGSDQKAAEWYLEAAKQGDASAQFALGRLYSAGALGAPDFTAAAEWYEKAAELGHVNAQFALALSFENGRGRARDDALAVRWYRRAAEQGDVRAQFNLGNMAEQGRGMNQSDTQAADWYHRAGSQGHTEAQLRLARMYEQGRGVSQSEDSAARWYRSAAESGEVSAQFIVGTMYEEGRGVTPDPAQAAKWYRKAAEQGNAAAQYSLGRLYTNGLGGKQDDVEAASLYMKAAEQGYAPAQFSLGWSYEFGRGVFRNEARAAEWYRRAAAQGHTLAHIALDRLLSGDE